MTQYTKFTNLPIYNDSRRTAITNTLIIDIPFGTVRNENNELISLRDNEFGEMYVLYTNKTLEDGREVTILEEENLKWSIIYCDPITKIRTYEHEDGRWGKQLLIEKDGKEQYVSLEEYTPDEGHKRFFNLNTQYNIELSYIEAEKKYLFNVSYYVSGKMREIASQLQNLETEHDYEHAYFCGTKEGMVKGIDELINRLTEVKQQINQDQSV